MGEEEKDDTPQKDKDLFAFVLMPIRPEFEDVYKLGIKETAAECGILAVRVDEQLYRENILEQIYRQIDAADLIVADMSGQNPNVFYEVGYAHAKGKLCVLMTKDVSHIPFDLNHHRHIVYGSIAVLKDRLREELEWARGEIIKLRSCGIEVGFRNTWAILEKSKFFAKGELDFAIDLAKRTNKVALTELHGIYLYTGRGWDLKQDGKACPSTESDIPGFHWRHALTPPATRFRKDMWTQIRFSASKQLAYTPNGEGLQDTYRCRGRVVVRVVTSEGTFDYPSSLDIEVSTVPF
jgi:hypothetical protein